MNDIVRITDSEIDVERIMSDIRQTIAEKRKDPTYRKGMAQLERAEREAEVAPVLSTRLIDKMHLPPTHRGGFMGKIANTVLSKLFLATKSFFSDVLMTQERFNNGTQATLKRLEKEIEEIKTSLN